MILGRLIGLVPSLINKWVIIGIGVVALLASAYWQGYKSASGACEKEKRKALEALIEYQQEILDENQELNDQIIEDLQTKKQKTRTIYKKVIEYVEANPDRTSCELDAAGLQLWNGETGQED